VIEKILYNSYATRYVRHFASPKIGVCERGYRFLWVGVRYKFSLFQVSKSKVSHVGPLNTNTLNNTHIRSQKYTSSASAKIFSTGFVFCKVYLESVPYHYTAQIACQWAILKNLPQDAWARRKYLEGVLPTLANHWHLVAEDGACTHMSLFETYSTT